MNANASHRQRPRSAPVLRRLCLTILLGVASTPLFSQEHIRVESIRGTHVVIEPGSMLTLPIRLTNLGDSRDRIGVFPRLPDGWRQLTQIPSASLDTGETTLRLVSVSPPGKAPAGTYRIDISLIDSLHRWAERLIPITVEVGHLVLYDLVQVSAPRFSVGGDEMTYTYEVVNAGNSLLALTIDARSIQGFDARPDPPLLQIPVGTAAQFSVTVTSPSDLARKEKHGLIVTVTPSDGGESRSITTLSDVLPRVASTKPDMIDLPLMSTVRFAGDNDQRGVQAEIAGFGSLREDKSDRLEFLVRTPETQSFSVLGIRDEYRIRYTVDDTRLYAGDWNYALTTLTEVGRYGFGLGGESVVKGVTLGGFFNQTRIGSPVRRQVAGYARYELVRSVLGGLNVLHRTEGTSATIVSTTLQTSPFDRSTLEVETGLSSGQGNAAGAVAARLNGTMPIGQYDIRYVNAGREFASYYRDVQLFSISISGYATRDIRLDLLARDERRNARLDTVIGFSPRTQFMQVGGGYSNLVSVYYRASLLSDPLSPARQDKREDLFQVRLSQRVSIVNVSAYADLGTLTDRTTRSRGTTSRYALSMSAQPAQRQSYSANVEFARTPDFATGGTTGRVSGSITASYRITDDTRAQVSYFTSRSSTLSTQVYSILDAALDHVFASQQRIGARIRSTTLTGAPSELAYSMEVGVPIAIPLGTVRSSGVLSGRLLDDRGNGIAGVYVTAGTHAAVTDASGLFAIRDIRPGTYALNVDRGTLGLDRILTVPLPYPIEVIGGEESSIVLRSLTPGVLQGTTRLFNSVPTGIRDSVTRVDVPVDASVGLVVDLTNGEERLRRVTNSKGVFVFTDLRPGTWTVRCSPIRLPDDHEIQMPVREVEISSGTSTLVTIDVVPRERRIRIIQDGGVLRPKQ